MGSPSAGGSKWSAHTPNYFLSCCARHTIRNPARLQCAVRSTALSARPQQHEPASSSRIAEESSTAEQRNRRQGWRSWHIGLKPLYLHGVAWCLVTSLWIGVFARCWLETGSATSCCFFSADYHFRFYDLVFTAATCAVACERQVNLALASPRRLTSSLKSSLFCLRDSVNSNRLD